MNIEEIIRKNYVTPDNAFKGTSVDVRFESLAWDIKMALVDHMNEIVSRTYKDAERVCEKALLATGVKPCCEETVRRIKTVLRDRAKEMSNETEDEPPKEAPPE